MTRFDSSVSRRTFLALTGGAASAACGGTSSPVTAGPAPAGGGGGTEYKGPDVQLAFWNGFTGGGD